ncbi:hypothetical protein [Clostridium senegalense]|uniref:hypothetical protein n=1 Tax=Clostridium senegalense TaxID=1465809 RepID=UPI001C103E63|nr:hypothetical protein [Clostridium senegalense]MBU5226576.1 hypothetical protein [Clostridium senegalense]
MKVFKMEKAKDENEFNSFIELKMKEDSNKINIINPKNSNSIYIINDIIVKNAKEKNEVKIYGCNLEDSIDSEDKNFDYDLLFYKTKVDKNTNILDKDYFIVLPGASLIIEFIKYDKNLALTVNSYEEEL